MLQAIVFDFDGLILDTELPQYEVWRDIYKEFDQHLPIERWVEVLGRAAWSFDFHGHLEELSKGAYDRETWEPRRRERTLQRIDEAELLPGVRSVLEQATQRNLKLAIASGSGLPWVGGYLDKHGLRDFFPILVTKEETTRHKPNPDPFIEAAKRLNLPPGDCLVLEDSPNGIQAAAAAGMYPVAVPNRVTRDQQFSGAARIIPSLEDLDLDEITASMA